MRQQSVIVGLFSLVLGLLLHFWLIPNYISVPSNMARLVLSPAFWPEILAAMIVLAGVFVLVGAFRQPAKPNSQDLASAANLTEDQQGSNVSSPLQEVSQPSLIRLLAFVTAMALFFDRPGLGSSCPAPASRPPQWHPVAPAPCIRQ